MALTKEQKALLKKMLDELDEDEIEELVDKPAPKYKDRQKTTNFAFGKRPNTFEKSADFNKFKSDNEIDKALWKNRTPEERRGPSKIVSTCAKCNTREEVNPVMCYPGDNLRPTHICDRCQK